MSLLRRTPKLSKKKSRKPAVDTDEHYDDPFDALTDNESNKDKNTSKQHLQVQKKKKQLKDNEKKANVTEESEHGADPVFEVINEVLCNHYNVDVDTISEISSTSDYSYNRLEDTSEFSSKDSLFHDSITSTPPQTTRRVKRISSVPDPAPEVAPQLKKSNSLSRKSSTARFFKGIFKKNKSESNNNVVVSEPDFPDINPREQRSNSEAAVVKLRRKSVSLRRRLSSLLSESAGPVTRSTSIRDFTKKSKSENMNLWSTSLQSLVENDIAVSYHDLSLINYDVLNTCSYEEDETEPVPSVGRQLCRSQSVSVQNVCEPQQVIAKNNRHSVPGEVLDRYYYKSSLNLTCTSEAASLPTLHQLEGGNNNVSSPGTVHRYRRRVGSASTEDTQARFRNGTANSFRSSGCSKLRRTNACRQVKRDPTPTPDRNLKIARESFNIDPQPPVSTENQQYEWRKLVGSIRRRVQRHGTSTATETPETEPSHQPIRRKSSLTHHSKLDFFRREKSRDEPTTSTDLEKSNNITSTASSSSTSNASGKKDQQIPPLAKQRCVGFDIGTETSRGTRSDLCDTRHVNTTKIDKDKLFVKSSDSYNKGVRKSDSVKPTKDNVKVQKSSNFSFRTNLSKSGSKTSNFSSSSSSGGGICGRLKEQRHMTRDDFLKATMRIFLVVSPPVGKMQVRSRSLNHLDTLGQTYHQQQQQVDGEGDTVVLPTDTTTSTSRDHSRSEPDCTMTRPHQERLLTVPATDSPVPGTTERAGSGGSDRIRTTTRRQMLSRSQVSSSEYFSVSFELGEDSSVVHGREEFLPATKCTSLGEALSKVCERRSIDISNCDIYIDGCRATTPYILNQETSALGGKTIRIAAKEGNSKKTGTVSNQGSIHNRKTSGSYRGKSSGLFFSSSTEDASSGVQSGSTPLLLQDSRPEYDQYKKQSKQRWSGFFGNNKDTRMESLSDILNQYSRHGVPNSIHPQSAVVDEEAVQALYSLEEDWRQLMDPSDLTERQQQQQTAIWELISTEVAYIKTLKVVTGLFLACLKSVQACNILTEIDTDKLFSNITEILDCNMAFWADYVFPAVVQMRTNREPVSPLAFYDGFVRMCETYRPYFRYCAEQARCQHYCRENHAHNEIFTAYLVWCETQKECNRLRLMDILVRPMQRLTKYGLLLKAISKNTDNDDEKKGLCTMIKSVDDFVNSVNSSLKQKQDNERLRGIMLRIESYDAVETKDDDIQTMVQKHNHLDLSQPMPGCPPDRKRHLLLEGDLKLKDATTSKMEVHCFLLTDILLICKPSSKKGGALMRVIRPPYLVDRLILQELSRETPSLALVYLNEFKTATAAFILQNNDMKKLKTWVECIRKAQGLYEQAKQTPTLGLMRQLSASVPGDEFLDGDYFDNSIDADTHSLQSLLPARSPLATSSRASRVSSLAHSHSGSVEMNDQSSVGSTNNQSRGVSIENENRTASISSDEGVQPLPADKSPVNQKNSLKQRVLLLSTGTPGSRTLTPNTLSVQPYGNLGQSLPNLTLGSPNVGTLHQNTLLVPSTRNSGQHLLSPNQRGISYPPPSPTRANLRRGFAISQSKNPPLIKTGHVNSTIGGGAGGMSSASSSTQAPVTEPTNFDFDVPVISGISPPDDLTDSFNRGQHRQAMMKRVYHRSDNRRYHTAGVVDDIKKNNERDTASILKRLSWNCGPSEQLTTSQQQPPAAPPPPPPPLEDHHTDT